jgi:hypothetical protein
MDEEAVRPTPFRTPEGLGTARGRPVCGPVTRPGHLAAMARRCSSAAMAGASGSLAGAISSSSVMLVTAAGRQVLAVNDLHGSSPSMPASGRRGSGSGACVVLVASPSFSAAGPWRQPFAAYARWPSIRRAAIHAAQSRTAQRCSVPAVPQSSAAQSWSTPPPPQSCDPAPAVRSSGNAGLSANHLAALLFPPTLRRLYVARDDDPAGDVAMATLTERAQTAGIEALRRGRVLLVGAMVLAVLYALGRYTPDLAGRGQLAHRAARVSRLLRQLRLRPGESARA